MSYERHTWECGETITAELMNNLEGGVEEALECCGGAEDFEPSWAHLSFDGEELWISVYGKFSGYDFTASVVLDQDAETNDTLVVNNVESEAVDPNPLPSSMYDLCQFVLASKIFDLFGVGYKSAIPTLRIPTPNTTAQFLQDNDGIGIYVNL